MGARWGAGICADAKVSDKREADGMADGDGPGCFDSHGRGQPMDGARLDGHVPCAAGLLRRAYRTLTHQYVGTWPI